MTSIWFVRHGETDWNALGKIQGQTDIPLNNTGRSQANECGLYLQDFHWDVLISSPLKRAKETASIINKYLDLPITEMDDFRERSFGDAEGMTVEERMEVFPDGIYPHQESIEALTERIMQGMAKIDHIHKGKKVLVVAHGAVINAIFTHLTDGEISTGTGKKVSRLANGSISHVQLVDETWQIKHFNQKDHLSAYSAKGSM
ncbi:histidine phosphatase family protein [Gracilibacillus sp. S3-1-1]|uniref:Histidine phosphatase family protein n=1 Tax=Gracilibacillus pellucidus TaxID=3095368 RepID=A0ACC6M0N0_9BACI|nr:histidine phosphatase family protein [Gracilibacillus sp. S3-1-1]MDX8044497.1 histidine phosphatase family protein [Gracilibacillus sp. S3-1-1]